MAPLSKSDPSMRVVVNEGLSQFLPVTIQLQRHRMQELQSSFNNYMLIIVCMISQSQRLILVESRFLPNKILLNLNMKKILARLRQELIFCSLKTWHSFKNLESGSQNAQLSTQWNHQCDIHLNQILPKRVSLRLKERENGSRNYSTESNKCQSLDNENHSPVCIKSISCIHKRDLIRS
jgi:hypothetical protein